jgi:hypothetical protein
MASTATLKPTRWDCTYHVVFLPKYRRKTLYKELRQHIGEVLRDVASQKACRVMAVRPRRDHTSITGRVEDSSPWVGSHGACCTCGSAGVIAPYAMWSETRLQRRHTHQTVVARGIGRVITASAISPETRRRHVGTNQAVMTRGRDRVITACPIPPIAKRSAKGAHLTSTWDGVHDQ